MDEKISRRERKKIHSKRVILEAAVKCFGKKGFQDTSIAEIMIWCWTIPLSGSSSSSG